VSNHFSIQQHAQDFEQLLYDIFQAKESSPFVKKSAMQAFFAIHCIQDEVDLKVGYDAIP